METEATELRLGLGPLAPTDRKGSVDLSFKKFSCRFHKEMVVLLSGGDHRLQL